MALEELRAGVRARRTLTAATPPVGMKIRGGSTGASGSNTPLTNGGGFNDGKLAGAAADMSGLGGQFGTGFNDEALRNGLGKASGGV